MRKYLIPEQCDAKKARVTVSSDEVLSITQLLSSYRSIPNRIREFWRSNTFESSHNDIVNCESIQKRWRNEVENVPDIKSSIDQYRIEELQNAIRSKEEVFKQPLQNKEVSGAKKKEKTKSENILFPKWQEMYSCTVTADLILQSKLANIKISRIKSMPTFKWFSSFNQLGTLWSHSFWQRKFHGGGGKQGKVRENWKEIKTYEDSVYGMECLQLIPRLLHH